MSLTTHLGTERRVWDTALLGIAYWEAQRTAPSVVHTPLLTKPRATAWTAAVKDAHDALRCTDTGLLSDNQIQWLVARTNDGQDLDELHGCLWGLDHANADAFITCWRDRHDEEVLLTPGDMIPVPEVMWPALADQPLVSRTTSINQPADGELPHARRYQPITLGDRQLEIVIDFEFEAELQEVLLPGFTAAAVHPYRDLADFANATGTANFPIRPRRHKPAVTHVTDALDTGATVVIVPELHVNAQALEKLAEIMAGHDSGPCLLIAGSRHEKIGKRKLNIATGLLAGVDEPLLHTKLSRAISPTPQPDRHSSSSTSQSPCGSASGKPVRSAWRSSSAKTSSTAASPTTWSTSASTCCSAPRCPAAPTASAATPKRWSPTPNASQSS
ncbi:hypothetical protein GKE82_25540 [Conexibacter sp. W3-3-2]|nr:hypothetical protein [Conexibacter sp. W3-3-2]